MTTKKPKGDREAIAAQIAETPTWPDDRVAAALNEAGHDDVDRFLVADVRSEMGAKHTWPKAKKETSS